MKIENRLPIGCVHLFMSSSGTYTTEFGQNTDLVLNVDQYIVYYLFNGTLCPYLGTHGKPCTYIEGNIVEIE